MMRADHRRCGQRSIYHGTTLAIIVPVLKVGMSRTQCHSASGRKPTADPHAIVGGFSVAESAGNEFGHKDNGSRCGDLGSVLRHAKL